MDEQDWLARRFEEHRSRLEALAQRMLGSHVEAEDAVQETWLRLSRSEPSAVHNLGGWLTTVVGRVCLDVLRSRVAHREEPLDAHAPDLTASRDETDPVEEALMAESVGVALLVVLDTLTPAERLAFLLHDMFAVPFDQIGSILGRSPNAAKMLASRARLRVQAADVTPRDDTARQTELVDAFLSASRRGDFAALLKLLDPDVVLRADPIAVRAGALPEVRGATTVAKQFAERTVATLPGLYVETPRIIWAVTRQTPRAGFRITTNNERITEIEIVFNADQLGQLDRVIVASQE